MKTSTKIILVAASIGTLGLSGLTRTVLAKQPQSQVAIMPQHHSSTLVAAQASDGDGEINDTTVTPEKVKQPQTQTIPSSNSPTQVPEVSDGDGEAPSALESMTIPSTTSKQKTPITLPLIDPNPPAEVPSPSLYNYGV